MNDIIKLENFKKLSKQETFDYIKHVPMRNATVYVVDELGITLEIPLRDLTVGISSGDYPEISVECYGPLSVYCPKGVETL